MRETLQRKAGSENERKIGRFMTNDPRVREASPRTRSQQLLPRNRENSSGPKTRPCGLPDTVPARRTIPRCELLRQANDTPSTSWASVPPKRASHSCAAGRPV